MPNYRDESEMTDDEVAAELHRLASIRRGDGGVHSRLADVSEMTDDEIAAALERERLKFRSGASPLAVSKREKLDAISAAFRASVTGKPPANPHPITENLLRNGPLSVSGLAAAIGDAVGRPMSYGSAAEVSAMASTVPQLPSAIADAARGVLQSRQSALLDDVRALTADLRVRNYNAEGYGFADIELAMPDAASGSRFLGIVPRLSAQQIQTFSSFGKLVLSIQSVANDDSNLLGSLVTAFANAAARAEAKALADVLEANKLPDGTDLFASANSNVSVATLTQSGLGTAFSLLRSQPTETGEASGAQCASLLVHADDETAALALIESLPVNRQPRLVASPYLSNANYWFAFADPATCPAIGRVLMVDADPSGVSFGGIGPASWLDSGGATRDFPGIALDASHTSAILAVSSVGIARLSKT